MLECFEDYTLKSDRNIGNKNCIEAGCQVFQRKFKTMGEF